MDVGRTSIMHRDDAIRFLATQDLAELSSEARAELLDTARYETWKTDAGWSLLPVDLRAELELGSELHAPDLPRYDDLLLLPIQHGYRGATNEFLSQRLVARGQRPEQVDGAEPNMAACPCCGLCTLDSRADFDICVVCWWEDGGQDNDTAADESGPNGSITLIAARVNFILQGIFDPVRDDLRPHQKPPSMFARGRTFRVTSNRLEEPSASWSTALNSDE